MGRAGPCSRVHPTIVVVRPILQVVNDEDEGDPRILESDGGDTIPDMDDKGGIPKPGGDEEE